MMRRETLFLVPQDPSDEPASVLLERIREQKKQMVKEGKLKAKDIKNDTIIFVGEDNLHYEKFADGTVKCIEEEIPFEVPEGWEWTRLGNLSSLIQYGLSNSAEAQGTHRLLRITDIQDGKVNWKDVPFTTVENAENYLLRKDDIVFARTGATVGKSFLVTELPFESVYASYLIRIRLFDCISPSYLYQFFNSYCYWEQITDKSVGVGQPNCNGTSLKELFIPLPPLHEQKRIVPAANALLKYASVIESERASLQEIINLAKSKIPLIRISGLQSDKVLLDGCNYLDPVMVENKWKHFKLELGDVILCTSASIGKASIVGPEAVGAIPYTGQIRFKMTQSLIREYFLYFANSDTYLNQIDRMKTGNCIQHYGPTHLKEVYIPIPPIEEQERIIKQFQS